MSTVWTIVDDSDPRFLYSDGWSLTTPETLLDTGVVVPGPSGGSPSLFAFQDTLHAVHDANTDGSFSFVFNGSSYRFV
jgi:hypothetical protein